MTTTFIQMSLEELEHAQRFVNDAFKTFLLLRRVCAGESINRADLAWLSGKSRSTIDLCGS